MELGRKLLIAFIFTWLLADAGSTLHADATSLISTGSVWKYMDDGSDQGSAWQSIPFDDSNWKLGPAQLGYGEGDEATVVGYGGISTNKFITTWFRRSFVITNNAMFTNLAFRILRDDGAAVYLNGTRVFISNMPETFDYSTLAPSATCCTDETNFFPYNVSPGSLVNGTNVVAVEVHQNDRASGDLSFDLEVIGQFSLTAPPSVTINSPSPEQILYSTNILLSVSAFGGLGRLIKSRSTPMPSNWPSSPNVPMTSYGQIHRAGLRCSRQWRPIAVVLRGLRRQSGFLSSVPGLPGR